MHVCDQVLYNKKVNVWLYICVFMLIQLSGFPKNLNTINKSKLNDSESKARFLPGKISSFC